MIFFAEGLGRIISRVSADGGTPQIVGGGGVWPATLPGHEDLLVSHPAEMVINRFSLRTGETRRLIDQAIYGRYLPTGHLVYVRPGRLMAVPFDLAALDVKGSPVPILDEVRTEIYGAGQVSISSDGTLIYVPGSASNNGARAWVDREGRSRSLSFPEGMYGTFQLSPDDSRLAIEFSDTQGVSIWIYEVQRGTRTRLTFEGRRNRYPIWSPDGKWVVFSSDRAGSQNLYKKSADGSGDVIRLTTNEHRQIPYSWSADGKWLAYTQTAGGSLGDMWILPANGGAPEAVIDSKYHESIPTFSPDGKWLAYKSDESGRDEVYVQRFPNESGGGRFPISVEGGTKPVWSSSGDELTFVSGNKLMSVAIETEPNFVAATPRILFDGSFVDTDGRAHDLHSDGRHLLIIQPNAPSTTTQLNVIVNWFEELKRLVLRTTEHPANAQPTFAKGDLPSRGVSISPSAHPRLPADTLSPNGSPRKLRAMTDAAFEPSDRSQIHRLPSRGAYDKNTVFDILDRGILAHVGFAGEHGPVVIPMAYARRGETVLLHGSAKSRLLHELSEGTDVCITVTLIDGLVLARSTFHHSMNYRSVVVFGRSREITESAAKNEALEHLVEHLVPGRGADARGASPGELEATLVVEVPMTDASAKMRTGPPVDEKRDLEIDIWAGVVPLELTPGQPVADEHTSAEQPIPDYVVGYEKGR